MADIARYFRFSGQPAILQLILTFCIVVVAGTLLFWLFLLTGSLFFGISLAELENIMSGTNLTGNTAVLKYAQFSQQAGLFLLPTLISVWMIKKEGDSFLKLDRKPGMVPIAYVIVIALAFIQVNVYTATLNEKLVMPGSFSGIQEWMRDKEDIASRLTSILLGSGSAGGLILNIFILAIMPAICEEFLFRGLVQQLFVRIFRSGHIGIFVTAIVFSSIHLQFYSFLPRFLLGIVFGYIFLWSGNLWYPVIAHFLNNLIPVLFTYISSSGKSSLQEGTGMDSAARFPFVAVILLVVLLYSFRRWSSESSGSPGIVSTGAADSET